MRNLLRLIHPVLISMVLTTTFTDAEEESYRIFTANDGREMEARFVRFRKDRVEIIRRDGVSFTVAPEIFSPDDQAYFSKLKLEMHPLSGRPWTANDFKGLLTKQKLWTSNLKPGAHKHLVRFGLDKVDLDNDDISDGKGSLHWWSKKYKQKYPDQGTWTVDAEGNITSSLGSWKYDKKSGYLNGGCRFGGCSVLMPHLRQIEFDD